MLFYFNNNLYYVPCFIEVIEINICKLSYNTKNNIESRSKTNTLVEMEAIVKGLFQCGSPLYAPSGKKVYVRMDETDLLKLFKDK